jgi:hypothetical protein
MDSSQIPPQALLAQLGMGYLVTASLTAVAKLRIADMLRDGPRSLEELAKLSETHPRSLHRALRALASLGIFSEDEQGRFGLTPLAQPLRTDVPGSMRDGLLMLAHPAFWDAAGEMLYTLRTGKNALEHNLGEMFFDYLARHREAAELFDNGVTGFTALENAPIASAYDFSGCQRVVDVGGGHGGFIAEVLKRNPSLKGTLFDLQYVLKGSTLLRDEGVADRCDTVVGDFFKSLPAGADAYLVKRVLHDWDDAECVSIMKSVRRALPAHGRVLAIDVVISPGNEPSPGKIIDLLMLSSSRGRERTERDFQEMFAAAGLKVSRVIPTPSPLCIVEGVIA